MYIEGISPRLIVFYGETAADLAQMPTTTKIGEGDYIHAVAPAGSRAIILGTEDVKVYMLRSSGWVDVTESGGGGGGGVTSYNQLTDKPQINSVTLEGNKSSDDIDVAPEFRVEGERLIFDQNQFGF